MVVVYGLVFIFALGASAAVFEVKEPSLHNEELATPLADRTDFRLPGNLVPTRYDIKLSPYFEGNVDKIFTFDGSVEITFKVVADTNTIVLHHNKITVDETKWSIRKSDGSSTTIEITESAYDLERHFYFIVLNGLLRADEEWILHLEFRGVLDDDMKGFYRSSYKVGEETRWLGTTQLQATEARRAFPCFDEPALKAIFKITIVHKSTLNAISNMPAISTAVNGDGTTTTIFADTPIMSTYLIAFIVSDFAYLSDPGANLRIFSQPGRVIQAHYSLTVSPPILNWLADYVKIPFTLPKMDEAAVPDFDAGAMENWGLVTYRERLILFEEGVSTSESKQRIATVIAHEYAHQWFGDLVSPHWWKDSWLNEGFATYFESFATAEVEKTWRLEEQFVVRDLQSSMGADARETSHPISHDVCSPASISAIFDTITYEKAGSVIRMMKHIVTPEHFREGLFSYLDKLKFGVAHPQDLWESMDEQIRDDPILGSIYIPEIMNLWITQMGYPVVTVNRNYGTSTARLTQERFLLTKSGENPDTHDYKWSIPLTHTTAANPDFQESNTLPSDWFWAEDNEKLISRIAAPNDWVLFNIQETGYYRVNYDPENWALLTTHLRSENYEQIHLLNRAQLLDDSFNLARAGLTHYSIPLALSLYLENEIDYVPWYSAFQALSFIDNKLNNDVRYTSLKIFVESLITKLYTHVGFEEHAVDDHVLKLNRAAAVTWACKLGVESCVQSSNEQLAEWIAEPESNSIKPDLRSAVYCTAVREGNDAVWTFLWNQYQDTTVATESTLLIASLGCTEDEPQLKSYLALSVDEDSGIRRQDARAVFTSVYNNPKGVDIALDFLINTWATTSNYYGGLNALGSLFSGIANRLNTQAQVNKLNAFFTEQMEALAAAGATAAISNAQNIMEETMTWQADHSKTILDWIEAHLETTTTPVSTTPSSSTPSTTTPTTTTPTTTTPTTTTTLTPTTTPGSASAAVLSFTLFLAAIAFLGVF